jgi:DNA-binding transcriptional MerR regulator
MEQYTRDTIESRITEELEKVVGIDQKQLQAQIDFLSTLKTKELEGMLKTLKKSLNEKILPLLELMTQQEQSSIAELGIHALGAVQSFKAAQILSDIHESSSDKKRCKAARKSLYRLKSAGIEIETSQKGLLRESKHQPYKALISPIDGTGTQLIILTQEMLAGDLHFLQVVASDEEGIIECTAKRGMTKKMFANLPENFARQMGGSGPMMAEADYNYAVSLVLKVEAVEEDAPEEYLSVKDFFGLNEENAADNPVFERFDLEVLKHDSGLLRSSEELFQDDTFLSWHIALNEVGAYAQELLDQEDTAIELSPQFQQERREEVYKKLAEKYCDEEYVTRLKQRLETMAFLALAQGNEENAKKALAAAVSLEDTPKDTLAEHPFVRQALLISLEAAEYLIEEGYNPDEIERDEYIIGRDEEGKIMVEFLQQEMPY